MKLNAAILALQAAMILFFDLLVSCNQEVNRTPCCMLQKCDEADEVDQSSRDKSVKF